MTLYDNAQKRVARVFKRWRYMPCKQRLAEKLDSPTVNDAHSPADGSASLFGRSYLSEHVKRTKR